MFKLILAAVLLLSGSLLLLVSARSFSSIKANLALLVSGLLFFAQAMVLLGQIQVPRAQPIISSLPSDSPDPAQLDWDQGGTLQRATLDAWRMGLYADRLASAADLLKALRRDKVFTVPIRSEQDFRPWAAALVACLEASAAPDASPIQELARSCAAQDGLKAYLAGSGS